MSEQYISKAKNPSNKDWANSLLNVLSRALENGSTPEEALEKLSLRQYDFLCDYGINLDEFILSPKQQKNIADLMRVGAGRPTFSNGYDKVYPKEKRDFYTKIINLIESEGGIVAERPKINYRNIDFMLDGIDYRIVFSVPTKKK